MEISHPYEETPPPLPKCFFKFEANKLKELSEAVDAYSEAVDRFGVFEMDNPPIAKRIASSPESFEKQVKYKTGYEVFVVVLEYVSEEAFLGFAGIEPYFESQSQEETAELIELYFPEGAVDELPMELQRGLYADTEEDEEEYDFEEYEEEDENYEGIDGGPLFDPLF
ncbi:uncharacterized protein LOC125500191 [Athalia rosae]|uniref:uncharacterized protein LOC125500191 n=1 Tax=Athalia rosae TaxID=37344 RepID=UPI002033EA38|nr:uncharacterized protein LOC125500191 [Athalia rosae]